MLFSLENVQNTEVLVDAEVHWTSSYAKTVFNVLTSLRRKFIAACVDRVAKEHVEAGLVILTPG